MKNLFMNNNLHFDVLIINYSSKMTKSEKLVFLIKKKLIWVKSSKRTHCNIIIYILQT